MDLNYFTIMWAVLIVVFTLIEAGTLGLTSIWFAVGSLAALITSAMGFNIVIQFVVFVIVAVVLLIYTRPIAKKVLKIGQNKTNIDAIIGETGYVTKAIKMKETGLVKVNGQMWTAKCPEHEEIDENEEVEVLAIEGVKLIVKKK
ncbi:NfeD family protein [Fusibacter sp. 3D3]|uniref:NfeD family protein n=1 Tax=Fusibacter sp. 3D3 TaxID=1048380 RepID=UPI0008539C5D|nr:NfeD family protein [Fusibacter sp. 3D3]GAU76179.1 putative activity regulator of membrane protease YbbK [Fusibacter sp. 3D3]